MQCNSLQKTMDEWGGKTNVGLFSSNGIAGNAYIPIQTKPLPSSTLCSLMAAYCWQGSSACTKIDPAAIMFQAKISMGKKNK